MIEAHLFIEGRRVQGVFFRQSAKHLAEELGLVGWIRNLDDGRVECVVQGEHTPADRFIVFALHGPALARVEKVSVEFSEVFTEEDAFRIIV